MSSRDSGRAYWDAQGARFARSFYGAPTTELYRREEERLFRRYFGELAGRSVLKLDLWNEAQNTEILLWAAQEGARCTGVDIATSVASRAQARSAERGAPIEVVVADVSALPFADASFDCVYTMGTLEHLPDPERAFAGLSRVLKPGGVVIVGVPNRCDPFLFAVASDLLQRLGCYPYGYERSYTNVGLRRQIERTGLAVTGRDGILFLPWPLRMLDMLLWIRYPATCRLTGWLLQPFRLLARVAALPRFFGYLTVCVAEKVG